MAKTSNETKLPILRCKHAKQVPTLESGLVDFEALELYLHPNPNHVPLYETPGWKYHHVNHPESSFKQWGTKDVKDRDPRLVALRNSPYQQLHMRVNSEYVYHNVHEVFVPHPATETVDMALRDFERLSRLGAACLYLNLLNGTERYKIDKGSFEPDWAQSISVKEKAGFITDVRDEYATSIGSTEVLPERLVTSALKRLSLHLQDSFLENLAQRRLAADPDFYPVRVPAHKTLLIAANQLVALEFVQRERPNKVLQPLEEESLAA